jgi:hypothetical protein
MKRGEVTIAVLADFSKAFDTVSYSTIMRKLHRQGTPVETLTPR